MNRSNTQKPKRPEEKPAFEGTSSNYDYAIQIAETKLGKVVGRRSDGAVRFKKHQEWHILQWTQPYDEAKTNGLPTSSPSRTFRIVPEK